MNSLISIIVPVYNVEKYLSKCIDSIISQTYKNLEIILVDDGSPDNCGKICDEYALQDNRIKVIHIKNGGVSNARNVGIEAATGQYIGFVDADDVVFPGMYKKLLQAALENGADIVQCNYCFLFEDGHTENMKKSIPTKKIENAEDAKREVITGSIYPSVATKLFKKELLDDVRFNVNLKVAEDRLFMYECCGKASKVILLENVGYCYFQRSHSVMHSFNIRIYDDDNYVSKIFIKNHLTDRDIVERMERRIVNHCINCICLIILNKKYEERLPDVRRELLVYGKRVLFRKGISLKTRIYILAIWLMPSLFYKMYSNIKRKKDK